MLEKPKRKPKHEMSRRRFLQVGLATLTSITAGITARWLTQSPDSMLQTNNCAFTWGRNTTRINETYSALLHEALITDGLHPTRTEVYDRAMEYQTCYDADGTVLSQELLYRDHEGAIIIFTATELAMNEDSHAALLESVLDTLSRLETFRVQDVAVQLSNGANTLIWQAPFYAAQTADADALYTLGQNP